MEKTIKNILLSEDHELNPINIQRINEALCYLQKLEGDENAGLLAHEFSYTVNDKIRGTSNHKYSTQKRLCEWQGNLQEFEEPELVEQRMQHLMDKLNIIVWNLKQLQSDLCTYDIAHLLSIFTIDYLHIHPFGDGIGLHSLHYHPIDLLNINYIEWYNMMSYNKLIYNLQVYFHSLLVNIFSSKSFLSLSTK